MSKHKKPPQTPFYALESHHVDEARIKKERSIGRELKNSGWWKQLVSSGVCHYCGRQFKPAELTMDHVVPLARGGVSAKDNVVPACKDCNRDKKLHSPIDDLFEKIRNEKSESDADGNRQAEDDDELDLHQGGNRPKGAQFESVQSERTHSGIISHSAWGDEQTQFFFELTPDVVLDAVEAWGGISTGYCIALGSYENRVYEVELEDAVTGAKFRRVVKFYRPGRWSEEQIRDEHDFLLELQADEIPVIAPIPLPMRGDGESVEVETLLRIHSTEANRHQDGILVALFPKQGGRSPDELDQEQSMRIGRLLARIHAVGSRRQASNRIQLSVDTYGYQNLDYLLSTEWVPLEYRSELERLVVEICQKGDEILKPLEVIRIHGDCHRGNLLYGEKGAFFLDFDDMLMGPPVQDLWLLAGGRDEESLRRMQWMLSGYEEMRRFDRSSLKAVEVLRALRWVHFAAWIAKRWDDPAFPNAFPQFTTDRYWAELVSDLRGQASLLCEGIC